MKFWSPLLLLIPCAAASAQTYSVDLIDIGQPSGSMIATHITNSGNVTGVASVEGGRRTFGFVWRDGVVQQLFVPQAGDNVFPRAFDIQHHVNILSMNESGLFCGNGSDLILGHSSLAYFSWTSDDPYPQQFVATNIQDSVLHDIAETPPVFLAVGNARVIVGTQSNVRKGFISELSMTDDVGQPARVTAVDGLAGPTSHSGLFAINDLGDAVGYGATATGVHHAIVRRASGEITDLHTLGVPGPSSKAFDISNTGHIVGQADAIAGRPIAFILRPGDPSIALLGTLGGSTSRARAVNDAGDVVGESWTADRRFHAFVYTNGQMLDLNTLAAASMPPGLVLTSATSINNAGKIVGRGQLAGRTVAFILTPGDPCPADYTGDGAVDSSDFFAFLERFFNGAGGPPPIGADFDHSHAVDSSDFFAFLAAFFNAC